MTNPIVHILLVADNPGYMGTIQQHLGKTDKFTFSVTHARALLDGCALLDGHTLLDGRARLTESPNARFDLILFDLAAGTDQNMANLAEINAHSGHVPIVAMLDQPNTYIATQAIETGAQECLFMAQIDSFTLFQTLTCAMQHGRIQRRLARMTAQQSAYSQLTMALGQSRDIHTLYQIIYQHACAVVDIDAFMVWRFDGLPQAPVGPSSNSSSSSSSCPSTKGTPAKTSPAFVVVGGQELDPARLPVLDLTSGEMDSHSQVIRTGETQTLDDQAGQLDLDHRLSLDKTDEISLNRPGSALVVPMKHRGTLLGVMRFHSLVADAYTPDNIPLLESMTTVATLALVNARQIQSIQKEKEVQQQLQQQERLAAVGQLTAGISHDFNNIMGTILLFARMAARHPNLPEKVNGQLLVIEDQAWHASRLIKQLLEFSRSSSIKQVPLNLVSLAKEQVKMLSRIMPENIQIQFDFLESELFVTADPTLIRQVLTNLAINARDAMPNGGSLRIQLSRLSTPPSSPTPLLETTVDEWIELSVTDTGTGIQADLLCQIFEPFFTTKHGQMGNGLGLTQVKRIIDQHNGQINVDSTPGKGTTFHVCLPALGQRSPSRAVIHADTASPSGTGETILLVEDQIVMRTGLAILLQSWHYKTMEASNGEEALAIINKHPDKIDLILSDVVMPQMGGVTMLNAMHKNHVQKPVIFLTGYAADENLEDLHEKGLVTIIAKPPNLNELAMNLRQILDTHKTGHKAQIKP